jgi:hypothetical protein
LGDIERGLGMGRSGISGLVLVGEFCYGCWRIEAKPSDSRDSFDGILEKQAPNQGESSGRAKLAERMRLGKIQDKGREDGLWHARR